MDNFRTFVVVNPRSANGSTGRRWSDISRHIELAVGKFKYAFSEAPRHATDLARKALQDGAEMIVSIGGDGTHNEVVNGFFDEGGELIREKAVFGIISRGTGCDLIKTLHLPKGYEKGAQVLAGKNTRPVDVGQMRCVPGDGGPALRHFINITDFGVGGHVVHIVNNTTKAFGGKVSFYLGTARGMMGYKNQPMKIELEGTETGAEVFEGVFNNVIVANGRFFGSGMHIAPMAEPDDGLFDVVFMGDLKFGETMKLSRAIYQGAHMEHPKIWHRRAKKIRASSEQEVLIDMDGEQPGALPLSIEVLPAAIQVKIP
ncbi:MAG: diacylglycerol kinase family lipid kinase [Chrysiogenetes bacterium]|nr:diacylglycerol kinase family lipid kinase [Chrysiogenetes bacterium]